MKTNNTLKNIVLTALFAAIISVTTAYILHIPVGTSGGYIHVGDCFIYLAACFLPLPYAMLAGAIGGGIADLLTAPMWILPTVIIKAILTIPFTAKTEKILTTRNVIALFVGTAITCGGYYVAEAIMFGNWAAPLASMVFSLVQATGSGILFVIIGAAFDKANIKNKLINMH
ncbi:MAG: TIGR04002 family protein [Negativicutes bacterium]|nr:TIGR04002 family protein [Negativicutes bacterium]